MSTKNTRKKSECSLALRILARSFIAIICAVMAFSVIASCIGIDMAIATNFSDGGYANEIMSGSSGDRGGWDSNVITDSTELGVNNATSEGLVGGVNDFLLKIGVALVGLTTLLCAVRLVVRAVFEIGGAEGGNYFENGSVNGIGGTAKTRLPNFFYSSQERQGGDSVKASPTWAREMLFDSGKYIFIALLSGTLISVIFGIVTALLGVMVGSAPDSLTTFNVGSISVTTTK